MNSRRTSLTNQGPLWLSGVDATTGTPLLPALSVRQVARILRRQPPDLAQFDDLRHASKRRSRVQDPLLAKVPVPEVDPRDLAQAGWGVVFSSGLDAATREALGPLLEHRRSQVGGGRLYRELELRPGETKTSFLARHDVGPGPTDPARMPYYLLLVGSPRQIPFEFQYQLDVQYAVGRLHFDTPDEYAFYACSVIEAETGRQDRPPRAAFFGVSHEGDTVTRHTTDHLVIPLSDSLRDKRPGWTMETYTGERATKERLRALIGAEAPPALLFTTGHGLGFPEGHPEQRERQGSLICHDWPGRSAGPCPLTEEHCLGARDITAHFRPQGLVGFHYACYSAATPRWDDFVSQALNERRAKAPQAFVARLPQRLLGHPRGGALAVVGHVERAWDWSFRWLTKSPQLAVFESALLRLLDGYPVGAALEYFNQRYAELATTLADTLRNPREETHGGDLELVEVWTALHDARNYILLGDPAIRLQTTGAPAVNEKPARMPTPRQAPSASVRFVRGRALIVGTGGDLPATVGDARSLAGLLGDPGRCAYPEDQICLLTDENARCGAVLEALDRLADDVARDPEATAIVYFSGHGIEAPDFHILPHGYDLGRLRETAISGALLSEKLRAVRARKLVVLLDCCHAGGQADIQAKGIRPATLSRDFRDELVRSSGRVLLASSRGDEVSLIVRSESVFTRALLEGLAGYGAFERDGYARILDIAMYVGRVVPGRTENRQNPILKVSNLEDNFALACYAGGEREPKELAGRSLEPAIPPAEEDDADRQHLRRLLTNRREALMLIQERMSEYIFTHDIPLQLVKSLRQTEKEITRLEEKLRSRSS